MKHDIRNNIEIILVEPGEPGNIGSACRAMNNMGFIHLGLVKPVPYKVSAAFRFAWNSHEILNNAREYPDIKTAIRDKGFVVAMSTRKGKERGHFYPLNECTSEIHDMASKTKVAVLFGCESWGLTNQDLQYANKIAKIHTADRFTSLNLAQAVLVTCYELLCSGGTPEDIAPSPALSEDLELCYEHVESVIRQVGYGTTKGDPCLPDIIMKILRKIAGRALLEPREVKMIRGLCSQVEASIHGYKAREKKDKHSTDE